MNKQKTTLDLSPSKRVYESASADVGPVDAVEELVDNAIDNWTRMSQRADDVTVTVTAQGATTVIEDDTGGLEQERIHVTFALGETFQDDIRGSIGAYGVGGKKALVRLATANGGTGRIHIRSRFRGQDAGIGFSVDEQWLYSHSWQVIQEEHEGMSEGTTVMETEAHDTVWTEAAIQRLKDTLANTYAKYIRSEASEGGSLNLVVNGETLEAPGEPEFSYTPFDGLHPRRYEGIQLRPEGVTEPIEMTVTVGLLRKASATEAGVDWYCQDRLVVAADRSQASGFGETRQGGIGKWTAHHHRLKAIVELETQGDTGDLPWDTSKSRIEAHDRVTNAVKGWLRRLLKPYYQANTNRVPRAFVEPYESGEVEVLDYTGRERVMDRPDTDTPQIDTVRNMATEHANMGVRYPGALEEEAFGDAYEWQLASVSDDADALETVDELPEATGTEEEAIPEPQPPTVDELSERVPRVGASTLNLLLEAGFEDAEDVLDATTEALTNVKGIGEKTANNLKNEAAAAMKQPPATEEPPTEQVEPVAEEEATEEPEPGMVRLEIELSAEDYAGVCHTLGVDPDDVGAATEAVADRLVATYGPMEA